jgi:hypothetical protein
MRNEVLSMVFLSLLILLTFLPACTTSESVLTEDDQAAIYTAVIRRVYLVNNTFGDRRFPVIYLVRATDDGVGDPAAPRTESVLLAKTIQEAVKTALDNLLTDFIWIDDRNEVIDSHTSLVEEGNGAVITVGNIHIREDRTVLVSASIYIASLAGGGMTYIVEKVDNTWKITGDTGVRWIS